MFGGTSGCGLRPFVLSTTKTTTAVHVTQLGLSASERAAQKRKELQAYSLNLSLEEVDSNGFLVILSEYSLAVSLDHRALANGSVAHDNHLNGRLHLFLAHTDRHSNDAATVVNVSTGQSLMWQPK